MNHLIPFYILDFKGGDMKSKIVTIVFALYIFFFSILGLLLKDEIISTSERRKLKTFPSFEFSSEYINEVDKYFLDHFPLRDTFRSIKANFNYQVLRKLDNNDIYLKDGYIFKKEYPTNIASINNFMKILNINKSKLSSNNNVYLMIIPDKNYYLGKEDFLYIDYDYIYKELDKLNIKSIDIRDLMELDDYYKTDTHWRQERLDKVVKRMSQVMNFKYNDISYHENVYDNFYGGYYSEASVNVPSEKLFYLTNCDIMNAKVWYLENEELTSVYNLDNLDSFDSYEVYLDGASSYIEITNDNSSTDRELVIFRDSFGSSITPLLINYYKKITLIDNRYIKSTNYLDYITFDKQDVLFMYSTLIVNNSVTLKG